jgi:putative endonuclease
MLPIMPKEHHYFVYILSNRSRTLYIGVTNDLLRRINEHREAVYDSFTATYRIHRLVHFEHFQYLNNAIAREKELKGWLRLKKIALIQIHNPTGKIYIRASSLRGETHTPSPSFELNFKALGAHIIEAN